MVSKKIVRSLMFLLLCFLCNEISYGQTFYGKVINENQIAVPYASVGIIGKRVGTISDDQGNFTLSLTNAQSNDSLFISSVGYAPQKFSIENLSSEKEKLIVLKRKTFTTDEGEVTASRIKTISFGTGKTFWRSGWSFSGIANGNEIGMVFKNRQQVQLTDFKFHLRDTDFDSMLYRINIYELQKENLVLANKQEIKFVSSTSKGWIEYNLDSLKISFQNDFAISVEVLKGWIDGHESKRGKIVFSGKSTRQENMFILSNRFTEMDKIGMRLSFYVDGFRY